MSTPELQAEIERLHAKIAELLAAGDRLESQLAQVALARDRLRLIDAEREAVAQAIATADDYHDDEVAATLRGLLERMK